MPKSWPRPIFDSKLFLKNNVYKDIIYRTECRLTSFLGTLFTNYFLKNYVLSKSPILEHAGELIFRAKVVNFSIRLGAKTGVMPSHNEDFRNDV